MSEPRRGDLNAVRALGAGVVGTGVVLAVHFGRPWMENSSPDCPTVGDCLGHAVQEELTLALILGAASLVVMLFLFRVRALLVVPVAFATQGVTMLLVSYLDGYWMPLPLDMFIGAACWAGTALVLGSRSRTDQLPGGPTLPRER